MSKPERRYLFDRHRVPLEHSGVKLAKADWLDIMAIGRNPPTMAPT